MDIPDKNLRILLVLKITEKKELEFLNKSFVEKELALFILENKNIYSKLRTKFTDNKEKSPKSKEFKKIVKGVRTKLRELFGVFYLRGFENAEQLINSITKENMENIAFDLLKVHRSSQERLRDYEEIYDKIKNITQISPKIILDLACGYNPFSYFFIKESFQCSPDYVCCDLSDKDVILFNKFFQNTGIEGNAFYCDLTKDHSELFKVNADICFLFKALDSLESASKNISEELLEKIKAKFIVVSFPTKSIGGNKQILRNKRAWFFKLLEKLGYTYEEFSIHNEMFLVVKK